MIPVKFWIFLLTTAISCRFLEPLSWIWREVLFVCVCLWTDNWQEKIRFVFLNIPNFLPWCYRLEPEMNRPRMWWPAVPAITRSASETCRTARRTRTSWFCATGNKDVTSLDWNCDGTLLATKSKSMSTARPTRMSGPWSRTRACTISSWPDFCPKSQRKPTHPLSPFEGKLQNKVVHDGHRHRQPEHDPDLGVCLDSNVRLWDFERGACCRSAQIQSRWHFALAGSYWHRAASRSASTTGTLFAKNTRGKTSTKLNKNVCLA